MLETIAMTERQYKLDNLQSSVKNYEEKEEIIS